MIVNVALWDVYWNAAIPLPSTRLKKKEEKQIVETKPINFYIPTLLYYSVTTSLEYYSTFLPSNYFPIHR